MPSLPDQINDLYLDVETTSFKHDVPAFHPYHGHRIFGLSVTWDRMPFAYYLPIRHAYGDNLNLEEVFAWLQTLINRSKRWVNHNVKSFDAHFLSVEGIDLSSIRLIDTLPLSLMLNTERGSHRLKSLVPDWTGHEMPEEAEVGKFLAGLKWHDGKRNRTKSGDYAHVPIEMMARYACNDVIANRLLIHHIAKQKWDAPCWQLENDFTQVLFKMERRGLPVDRELLMKERATSLIKMVKWTTEIAEKTGREFNDHESWYSDLILTEWGLPPFLVNKKVGSQWTKRVSFDKEALAFYIAQPFISDVQREVLEAIKSYRTEASYKSTYVDGLLDRMDDDCRVHPKFRLIRTGRIACSDPNGQNQTKRTKKLFNCLPGRAYFSADADQIEFRLIVHYIQDVRALRAYEEDPYTDWHEWAAGICESARDTGKRLNFTMAYGAGEARTLSSLSHAPEVIESVKSRLREGDDFDALLNEFAKSVYKRYHQRLPGIRITSDKAMTNCMSRGFVFNAYGRRRHLGRKRGYARKAFNSVVQGTAMDFIKERMIACDNDPFLAANDVHLAMNVHDEILFDGPEEFLRVEAHQQYIVDLLAKQDIVKFRVPLTWSGGYANTNWSDAASGVNGEVRSRV